MPGVIHYSTAQSDVLGEQYFLKSVLRDTLLDKSKLEFDGNKAVLVHTPEPFPIQQYSRSGSQRYGNPENAVDTVQRFELTYDWAYTGVFDAGDKADSVAYGKQCARRVKDQHNLIVNPSLDRMALYEIAHHAGTVASCASNAFTSDTIFGLISAAEAAVFNHTYSSEGLTLIIPASHYDILRRCPQFEFSDKMGTDAIEKGLVGTICNCKVQKLPDDYMPNNVFFMIAKKDAAFADIKYQNVKVHEDPPGISGSLMEGRFYCGAGVRGPKAGGVYVLANSSYVSAAPTLTKSGTTVTCSSAGTGNQILYTTDGSDPRYSVTASVYSGGVACTSGDVFKAVIVPVISVNQTPAQIAVSAPKFASSIAEVTV